MSYRLGIDVGGTNTDAVIIDNELNVISKAKHPTTTDVSTGIYNVINKVLNGCDLCNTDIEYAMLGTTHCANAIVERKNLNNIAIVRIGKPATQAVKPLIDWPEELKNAIGGYSFLVSGGHEYDGEEIAELDEEEIRNIAKEIKGKVSSIAITSVFSPVNDEFEERAKEILNEELEDVSFSLSNEIGSIGLVERENATILNAAVVNAAEEAVRAFKKALKSHGIEAKKYFGQNDGTLMSVDYALQYPILTIASGPTNSIRGAASLAGLEEGIVVDVGGTTTDIGALQKGFPRESAISVEIGGVKTNFRMPDLITLGLGGGSIVNNQENGIKIGPESVGYRITEESLIFGGETLTATDISVAKKISEIGDPSNVKDLENDLVERAHEKIVSMVEEGIDRMKTSPQALPTALVGGGSVLLPQELKGVSEVYKPNNFEVANAIGVAIAQVSGEIEKIFNIDEIPRDKALDKAKDMAREEAIEAGADPDTIEIVNVEDVPLAYLPGNATRISVKAAGQLRH